MAQKDYMIEIGQRPVSPNLQPGVLPARLGSTRIAHSVVQADSYRRKLVDSLHGLSLSTVGLNG